MSRLTRPRASLGSPLAPWVVLAGLCAALLGLPRPARAAPPSRCVAAQAISELEPQERDRLRQMCEATGPSAPLTAYDRTTISAGLHLEGWKAAFVARAVAHVQPPEAEATQRQRDHERWLTEQLARTRTRGTKEVPTCAQFHEALGGTLDDLEHDRAAVPMSLRDLESDRDCIPSDDEDRFEAMSQGWRLLTLPRRDKDVVEAWSVDLDALEVLTLAPIPVGEGDERAWLLLLPKDRMVAVSIQQPDLDVPWIETRRLVDIDFTVTRRRSECVIIEAGTDAGSDWSVVVDGSPTPLEAVSSPGAGQVAKRAILALPREPVDPSLPRSRRAARELVFVSAANEAAPWVSSLVRERAEDHGRCRSVAYDLTGLYSPKEHIGVAQVAVDQQCRDRGIVPSRIRSYVEGYAERADKTLIPLDTWAEVMEVFRDLESRLGSDVSAERGASRGDLDDSEQMIVLASELRRKGIDSLLYFDVRCPKPADGVTVIGTRVDLDSFVGRAKSKVTGIDTDELLAVRSHDSHSQEIRESMEVVLSDLLVQPHVRFVDAPRTVERGTPHKLRAVGTRTTRGLDIGVWALRGTNAAMCQRVEEFNDLSNFDRFDSIRTIADRNGTPVMLRRTTEGQLEVELGGLEKGTYLTIATEAPAPEGAPYEPIGYAVCFDVEQRDLTIFGTIAGFRQLTLPRTAPVSTRFSFVRVGAGVRFSAWEYFEFGGQLGYELTEYTSDAVPKWDDLALVDLDADGQTSLSWQRHGAFAGPFVGLRVPFGRFPWPMCRRRNRKTEECVAIRERRQANPSLATFFLDAQGMVNVGIANTSGLPNELFSGRASSFGADFDLGLTSGVRIRPRRSATFGVFGGLLLTDLSNANADNALEHEFWTNDWGVRGMVGFELGFAQPAR